MPNIKSAKKRVIINEANYMRNKSNRSALKTALKKVDAAIETGAADKEECAKAALIKIDQSVTKGILHKNTAARKKSSIAIRLNKTNA